MVGLHPSEVQQVLWCTQDGDKAPIEWRWRGRLGNVLVLNSKYESMFLAYVPNEFLSMCVGGASFGVLQRGREEIIHIEPLLDEAQRVSESAFALMCGFGN
jgi:hypothetical protein